MTDWFPHDWVFILLFIIAPIGYIWGIGGMKGIGRFLLRYKYWLIIAVVILVIIVMSGEQVPYER